MFLLEEGGLKASGLTVANSSASCGMITRPQQDFFIAASVDSVEEGVIRNISTAKYVIISP